MSGQVSIGSKAEGYPCPKDGAALTLLAAGAWCPECHTVWREADEVSMKDLDRVPCVCAQCGRTYTGEYAQHARIEHS